MRYVCRLDAGFSRAWDQLNGLKLRLFKSSGNNLLQRSAENLGGQSDKSRYLLLISKLFFNVQAIFIRALQPLTVHANSTLCPRVASPRRLAPLCARARAIPASPTNSSSTATVPERRRSAGGAGRREARRGGAEIAATQRAAGCRVHVSPPSGAAERVR